MKFYTEVCGPLTVYPNDFGNPLTLKITFVASSEMP